MKKVTAFVGSARKGNTYDTVVQFLGNLKAMGDIETEIVRRASTSLGSAGAAGCASRRARSTVRTKTIVMCSSRK